MTPRALAALALGGSLYILLSGSVQPVDARQFTNNPTELIDRYRQTLTTDQGNLTLHYLLGVALLRNDQNAAALGELQTAYPAYQESIEAHYNLAIASLRLEDLVSTELYLEQAVALGADDISGIFPVADLYFNMALKSQERGEANEAIRYFHKVLIFDPERYEVYRQLGDLYAHRSDTALAIKSFHTYLEHFPDDPVSRDYLFALEFNQAQDLLAANDLSGAEKSFSTALGLQPNSPTALYYLGYIAYAQHHPEQAVVLLNKAFLLADDPLQQSIRPLLYNSALALRKDGRLVSAQNAVTLLANHESALFDEVFLAGTLNLELGNHRAAYEYLRRAVSLKPNDQGAKQNLLAAELGTFNEFLAIAKIHLHSENLPEAEAALQKASALQPQSTKVVSLRNQLDQARKAAAAVYFFNAQAALDAGDFATALDQVNAGLAIEPENSDGLALRNEINTALTVDLNTMMVKAEMATQAGNWDQAAEVYARILAIAPQHSRALAGREGLVRERQQQVLMLLVEGQKKLDAGQADQAINAFSRLLALEPDHEQALGGLDTANQMRNNRLDEFLQKGRQAMGRRQFLEAREWFTQAKTVDSSSRAEQALAELQQLVRQNADLLAAQAERAGRDGKYKNAEQLFTQALSLVPEHNPSLAGRRDLVVLIDQAINSQLREATEALQKTDYATATHAYQKVLEIAPENSEALEGLKVSRERQIDELDRLVAEGQRSLDAGDLAEAGALLAKAMRQDAYHKEVQQLRQRLEQVRQAGAKPGDEHKLYLQGIAYYTQGQYPEAIKSWETVLLLNPDHIKSTQNIAKTKRKLHQIEEYRGN